MPEAPTRIGQLLIEDRLITRDELDQALALQAATPPDKKERIGQILVSLGVLEKYQLIKYLVIQGTYKGEI